MTASEVVERMPKKMQPYYGALRNLLKSHALLIDDECDEASLNYKKPEQEPTKIYASITKLRRMWTRNACHYVGYYLRSTFTYCSSYTATPQPNLLYDPNDSLFPDFLWTLENTSSAYIGLDMFRKQELDNVVMIPYEDYPGLEKAPGRTILPSMEKRGLKRIQEEWLEQKLASRMC
jgi:hypothetical protein